MADESNGWQMRSREADWRDMRASFCAGLLLLTSCASEDLRKRTTGALIDDVGIEHVVMREIKADERLKPAHLIVVSVDGVVLLAGQLPTEELKTAAQEAAERVRKVRKIHNEIEVAPPTNIGVRTNDKWMKTKVKTALLSDENVDANLIKVVVENSVIYLMGTLPRQAGDAAAEIARSVFGVQKVVKVFEYVD